MIELLPADDRTNFREFLNLPFRLYKNNPLWIPPLVRDIKEQFSHKNPFFQHAEVQPFIAKQGNAAVGRITAIFNQGYVDYYDQKTGFFGFFDCINDRAIANRLVNGAKEWLKDKGMSTMLGPMNFSSNEEWGLLIEGFDKPSMVMMPYNFPYYEDIILSCGLTKAKDLYAYIAEVPNVLPEKVYRISRIAEKRGFTVRPIRLDSFRNEMLLFKDIYNSAWEKNWGFMPMSNEEIEHTAKKLKPIMVPELTLIAEYSNKPVGFMMILPDFNFVLKYLNGRLFPFGLFKALWYSRKIKDARLLLLGIKEGFRRRGVDSLLFIEALNGLKKAGYNRVEFSWVLEDNYPVQRIIETINTTLYKKYRIYEAKIQ